MSRARAACAATNRRVVWFAARVILPAVVFTAHAIAQTSDPPPKPPGNQSQLFPPKMALGGAFVLPTVHYSQEIGFGLGAEVLFPFLLSPGQEARPSEVRLKGLVTFKGQTRFDFSTSLYFRDGTHFLRARVSHRGTSERFYGIGPNTPTSNAEVYRPRRLLAYVEGFHQVLPYFKAGVRGEMEFFEFLERTAGGQLEDPTYANTSGEMALGLGVVLEWDTRDRRYSPSRGLYYQVFGLLFDDALGSDFDFNNYNIDLRNYFSLGPEHVFATQLFLYGATDSPPFWRYASLGGRVHTRGYRRDRFLDQVLVAVQGEYRAPVVWRLSASVFGGVATVAPSVSTLEFQYLHPTIGFGLNLHYKANRTIVARLDNGFGEDGIHIDFGINESF